AATIRLPIWNGRVWPRRLISTTARFRFTADRTRSSATSFPSPSSVYNRYPMDFDLTDEQRLLKDSVDRLIADRYGDFERRKIYQQKPGGWSCSVWQDFAAMGLTAVPFDGSMGGTGGRAF